MTPTTTATLFTDDLVVTDAGIETVLLFQRGVDLPSFATFPLLEHEEGRAHLESYFADFLALATARGAGIILETPTWRANRDWGATLGYSPEALRRVAHDSVEFSAGLRSGWSGPGTALISGCIGPRGDGYVPGATLMTSTEAAEYHSTQVDDLADAGVDLVTSFTFSYVEEGIGLAAAAAARGVPAVVGFTVETDGRLPSGTPLGEAIEEVDAATGSSVAWYMVNCAHPEHVAEGASGSGPWQDRVGALRANASRMSHAELDAAEELDAGDPADLATGYAGLRNHFPNLRVVGGCCGTDISHVAAITQSWGGASSNGPGAFDPGSP